MKKLYKKTILKNGIRVISIPIENAKSVTVLVLTGAGSKYESKDVNGISHFLEHMFFKGTKNRPDTLKISEAIDMIGGEYNAFTSKEVTGFWAKVEKSHCDTALEWVSDLFLNPKFDEKEIEKEKGVVIEEMNMYFDTPVIHIWEIWESLLYKDQPAGWKIVGTKESISNFSRQKVLDYYKLNYSPKSTIVCVAGAIKPEKIEKEVEKYFKVLSEISSPKKEKVKESQINPEVLLQNKKTDQTHFCLGVRTYDIFDKRKYVLALMATILGGNMSSRLFIKIRHENSLAYSVHTSSESTTDTGYLVTNAGVDPKNFEKAVNLIVQEYKRIKNEKISEKELQKAKEYLKGTTSLSLDSTDSQASFYASQELLEDNILSPEQKFKLIDEISINDIKEVAEDIFVKERINLAAIGPFGEGKPEEYSKKLINLMKI